MEPLTIMVCVADHQWTLNVLHLACALARNTGMDVALVKLLPVRHPSWLGTDLSYENFTQQDYFELRSYQEIAEDYGVRMVPQFFQYITLVDAIAEAAEHYNAGAVFATLPHSVIPYWRKYQLWSLKHRLRQQKRELYALERPSNLMDWAPSVTAAAIRK